MTNKKAHKPLSQIAYAFPQVYLLVSAVEDFIANYDEDLGGRSRSFDKMVAALTGEKNERSEDRGD